jgi:hypothetical protein
MLLHNWSEVLTPMLCVGCWGRDGHDGWRQIRILALFCQGHRCIRMHGYTLQRISRAALPNELIRSDMQPA